MPVKVRCSSCDKVLTVPDTARGKAVKCPQCDTKIAVPTGDSQVKKPARDKSKTKAAAARPKKPADSEDGLMSMDLRRAEDTNARICSKCGFDMSEMDEEETECPKCGFDIEAGGLGIKARKRALKGPDPADFYPGLAKDAWKFVLKQQVLAWRTALYTLICLVISMGCAFMFLWISAVPPRGFFALGFSVAFLVIPGWLWYLDTEVIKLTLERKDKFKKLNFDFFLASSKGVMSVAWAILVAGPILILPGGIGYYMVHYNGQPEWVLAVCLGIGAIPVLWILPVVMSHMTMPIPYQGWMFWKVLQFWGRTIGASSIWLMWLLISNIPMIAGAATIAAVWGNDLATMVQTMESNADINRRLLAAQNAPKGGKNAPPPIDPATIGTPSDVNFKPLIGPSIILAVMCAPIGFIALFNMRINGQFTFFFRERLNLIDKAKEYKYVAKKRKSDEDDDDDVPQTMQKDLTEGAVIAIVFALVGGVGGLLYGSLTAAGVPKGVGFGVMLGCALGLVIALIRLIVVAAGGFTWERARKIVFEMIAAAVIALIAVVVFASMGETFTLPS